jgi:hypothetical protein
MLFVSMVGVQEGQMVSVHVSKLQYRKVIGTM